MSYFWSNKHNVDLYEQDKHMQSKLTVYDMKHDFTNGNRNESNSSDQPATDDRLSGRL